VAPWLVVFLRTKRDFRAGATRLAPAGALARVTLNKPSGFKFFALLASKDFLLRELFAC
jgi:hypothetical protein